MKTNYDFEFLPLVEFPLLDSEADATTISGFYYYYYLKLIFF